MNHSHKLGIFLWVLTAISVRGLSAQDRVPAAPAPLDVPYASQAGTAVSAHQALSVHVTGPETIVVGAAVRYQIRISNRAPAASGRLRVEARLPAHVEIKETIPKHQPDGEPLTWQLESLAASESIDLEIDLIANAPEPIAIKVNTRMELEAELRATVTAPKLHLTVTGPEDTVVNDRFDCRVTVKNTGTGQVTRGGLQFEMSEGIRLAEPPPVPRAPYTLGPGQSLAIALRLQSTLAGDHGIKVQAEADGGLKSSVDYTVHVRSPMLKIELTGPEHRVVGMTGKYTVHVESVGESPAEESLVFLELPENLEYVASEPAGVYEASRRYVYWRTGTLKQGDEKRCEITTKIVKAGKVELRASTIDRRGSADEAYLAAELEGRAAVSFMMTARESLPSVGSPLHYDIVLSNRGTKAADDLSVRVNADGPFRFATGPTNDWTSDAQGWVLEKIRSLEPGKELRFTLTLQADAPGTHRLSATLAGPDLAGKLTWSEPIQVFDD